MFPSRPLLQRGVKVHPIVTPSMTFQELWSQTEADMKRRPFRPDVHFFGEQEKYAWVDALLEEMYSHIEEDDDEYKDAQTFDHWDEENLAAIDASYQWFDSRLEELSSCVEEEDDDAKNDITFNS